jgi:DNA-binding GntR family transcriptional regulator
MAAVPLHRPNRPTADARRSAAGRAAEELRRRIEDAELAPGTRLAEVALAAELDVSRNSLREAFATLAAERLLVRRPNRGVVVASPDADQVREIYQTRRIIELGALRFGRLTPPVQAELRRVVTLLAPDPGAVDRRSMGEANQRLHTAIAAMTMAPDLQRTLRQAMARMRLAFQPLDTETELHPLFAHRNLEYAHALLAGRQEQLYEPMAAYLDEAERFVLEHLREREDAGD